MNQKEAIKPINAIGWASYPSLWYSNCTVVNGDWKNIGNLCSSFGTFPSIYVTSSRNSNGVPSCNGQTWTNTTSGTDFYMWNGNSSFIIDTTSGTNAYIRCVK
ncbi:hypothetical protein [Aliarcobacter butzleri]|uniref:hypothetical protein n=1 Tax=Aliarcobacter butzleri TaxID=28197 RepID=UPI00126A1C6A|nr:hypothetical protein [Aliarcobacter butzleri]